ncbi:MAG: autotransporter outer membrane beta-barrel domain-containing protein, partial [Xanthobacteraceae bacterium]|nr:autotransporter outer membrane beta-barrel domain-containing protein [Xanthobacteraceae bacterium]
MFPTGPTELERLGLGLRRDQQHRRRSRDDRQPRHHVAHGGICQRLRLPRNAGQSRRLRAGGGQTSYGLSTGLGTGKSDAFQVGAFGSQRFGAAYISGILAYSYHRMTTDRTVTIAGADHLRASFDAHNWGGRIEGGYRLATPVVGITPYGAYQAQWVHTPSYSETVVSGTPAFALSYDAKTTSTNRVEAGVWFDKSFAFYDRTTIGLRVRGAWAHDRSSDPNINATFQSVPGA